MFEIRFGPESLLFRDLPGRSLNELPLPLPLCVRVCVCALCTEVLPSLPWLVS